MAQPFLEDPVGFIFGGNTGLTYSDLKRRREIANAIAARQRRAPQNVGEGLTYLGEAVADRFENRRLAEAERDYAGRERELIEGGPASTYTPPVVAGTAPLPGPPAAVAPGAPPVAPGAPPVASPLTGGAPDANTMFNPASGALPPGGLGATPPVGPVPAVAPVAPAAAPPPRAGREPPPHIKAIIDARVPPEQRPYYYQLALKESSYRPELTSKTGAAGLFQFTRGTGRQYGIEGDARYDPVANTDAAVRFTEDNAGVLRKQLGREPTFSELALAHQQGAGTAAKMLTGTGNAPAYNLAVNNAGGLGPQAAANRIMAYYGMPGPGAGAGAPPGSRDAIADVIAQQRQQPPTPQEMASGDLQQEVLGGRGGGPLYPPTAAAGRAGVVSDAPAPGTSPLTGAVSDPSIGDTLQNQRAGGIGGIMPPAPPIVLPQVAQNRARTVPVTASDMPATPLGGSVAPPAGAPPPAPAAPAASPYSVPPSVVPRERGPEPAPARVFGPDAAMERDMRIMSSDVSPQAQEAAKNRFMQSKHFMDLKNQREQERYKNEREAWEKHPERVLKETIDRLSIEEAIAKKANQPVEAELLRLKRDQATQDLAKAQFEAGRPRELGLEEKELDVAKKRDEAAARKQVEGGPPNIDITAEQGNTLSHFTKASTALEQYKRIPDADKILSEGLKDELVGKLPFFGNKALSDKYRAVRNAAQNLIQAHLRDTSGAAIGAQEMTTHHAALIPIYGDDPVTMRNKAQQREGITSGMYLSLGKARPLADYELNKRKVQDAEEQEKLRNELPRVEPGTIIKNKSGRKKLWTGTRWEDDF